MLEHRSSPQGPVLYWNGQPLDHPERPRDAAAVLIWRHSPKPGVLYVLFGAGHDYRVRELTGEWEDDGLERTWEPAIHPAVFEPRQEVLDACERSSKAKYFTNLNQLSNYVSGYPGHDAVLVIPEEYQKAFPEEAAGIEEVLWDAERSRRVRKNTALARGSLQVENLMRNLATVHRGPAWQGLGRPLEGATVYCVAAGPSLDRNADLLSRAARAGHVFTVSTAGPVVMHHHGVRADVHSSVESLDQSETLRACRDAADLFFVDITANPRNVAAGIAGDVVFGLPNAHGVERVCSLVRSLPLAYGSSVATVSPSLARELGARRIVLVGQDLSYSAGQQYATGTGREDFTVEDLGTKVRMHRPEYFYEKFRSSGIPEPPKELDCQRRPGWGGGADVPVTADMMLFFQWFKFFGETFGGDLELINATEGGVHIPGWQDRPLSEVLDGERGGDLLEAQKTAFRASKKDVEKYVTKLRNNLRRLRKDAKKVERKAFKRPELTKTLHPLISPWPEIDAHLSPALTRVIENENIPPRERQVWVAREAAKTAERLLELLDGG